MNFRVALVHNNEIERLNYLRPNLKQLCDNLKIPEPLEYSYQSLRELSWPSLFYRAFVYSLIRGRHETYLDCNHQWKAIYQELRSHFRSLIKFKNYGLYRKHISIESAVSKKHFYLFSKFVDSKADYLLVFENDAIIENLNSLVSSLSELTRYVEPRNYVFGILGGGLSHFQLHTTNVAQKKIGNLIYSDKAYTNTAVAYVITRNFATILNQKYQESNSIKQSIPIDWLLNSFFAELSHQGIQSSAIQFEHDPVIHGSRVGLFKSWQLGD